MDTSIRPIKEGDNPMLAAIIRKNLEKYRLDIPGTAYFDPQLECLYQYYAAEPYKRAYLVAADCKGKVLGGVGIAEFEGFVACAELQKLYLSDQAKGMGLGRRLLEEALRLAAEKGYRSIYLETHSRLTEAVSLYKKAGFVQIEPPPCVMHSTMDLFYKKEL